VSKLFSNRQIYASVVAFFLSGMIVPILGALLPSLSAR